MVLLPLTPCPSLCHLQLDVQTPAVPDPPTVQLQTHGDMLGAEEQGVQEEMAPNLSPGAGHP